MQNSYHMLLTCESFDELTKLDASLEFKAASSIRSSEAVCSLSELYPCVGCRVSAQLNADTVSIYCKLDARTVK